MIFTVERSILRKLEQMQSLLGDEDGEDSSPTPPISHHWPPIVTRLPELRRTRPHRREPFVHLDDEADDRRSSSHNSFLLPTRIPGHETDAWQHLLQLAELAKRLNRTLILPHVGRGYLGCCYHWELETYYDLRCLPELGVAFAKTRDLSNWAKRYMHTTAQVVSLFPQDQSMTDRGEEPLVRRFDEFYETRDLNLPGCFETKFSSIDLNDFPHLRIYLSRMGGEKLVDALSWEHDTGNGASLHNSSQLPHDLFLTASLQSPPDILVVQWNLRFPVFPPPIAPVVFHYSEHLTALAEQLAPSAPYLAIYWHTEGLPADVLSHCADLLVDTVSRLLSDPSASIITTVWFASDLPYSVASDRSAPRTVAFPRRGLHGGIDGSARSGHLSDKRVKAMEILKEALADGRALAQWHLTDLTNELRKVQAGTDDALLQDNGVLGILDKLICSRAALFVRGARACGVSSFAQQIVDMRKEELARRGNEMLKNIVDVFG
ncbi:hypothetical protein LshimejAT787_0806110 [Lyophyllum shimeji]|uniref:Uncharacterized protein n=1 Tax=Lyophyllum shimeji TaxID=47721 RepID=A0A9P3PQE4_LYOSH|nr:hypothetical protein LshimejAT787_0806110 [Lyophyllum shimeji]